MPASALVFNHSSELCILVYIIYDLVINVKQTRKLDPAIKFFLNHSKKLH